MIHAISGSNFALYATRKTSDPYPYEFVKIVCDARTSWIITEGCLPVSELNRCDLVYHGHNMTFDAAVNEIRRLRS